MREERTHRTAYPVPRTESCPLRTTCKASEKHAFAVHGKSKPKSGTRYDGQGTREPTRA